MRRCCQLPAATQIATAATAASVGRDADATSRERRAIAARSAWAPGFASMAASSACYTRRVERAAVKIIVIAGLVAVVASLFSALYYLYRDHGHGTRMVKALALRVALSAALIAFLVAVVLHGLDRADRAALSADARAARERRTAAQRASQRPRQSQ